MAGDVRRVELALVDEGLDVGVVLGDLGEDVVAQQVAAGVADVADAHPAVEEEQGAQGAAHAVESRVLVDVRGDGTVTVVHRLDEHAGQPVDGDVPGAVAEELGVERQQGLDHQLRGDLAGGVAAHAVGQGEQVGRRHGGILVVAAHQATVGAGGEIEGECLRRHASILTVVWPMRNSLPARTGSGWSMR